jgi:hypothetical protein
MGWPLVLAGTEGFMFKLKCMFKYTLARGRRHQGGKISHQDVGVIGGGVRRGRAIARRRHASRSGR